MEYRLPSWRYWRIVHQDLERGWIRSKEDAEGSAVCHPFNTTREMLMISEYSLPGSYRKIIHLPKTFTWSHVSYTDPDISLVQSDEDKILGENPAAEDDPEGESLILSLSFSHSSILHPTHPVASGSPSIDLARFSVPSGPDEADTQANSKHSKSNSPSAPQHTQPWLLGRSQGKKPLHGIKSA
jgi:hypothetical protein